jgi:hypothetical protein
VNAPIRCACPSIDALDCMQRRCGIDMKIIFGEELTETEENERCECPCHDHDEDDEQFCGGEL